MRLTQNSNMKIAKRKIEEFEEEEQKELIRFHKAFIAFLVASILLIVSTLSKAVNINGIPPIFAVFEIFSYAGHITLFISLLLIHRFNKSFFYSFLSLSLFLVLAFIVYLCMGSSRPVDNAIGRGFQWGKNISEGVFYLYYFHGCLLFFEKHGFSKGPKTFKIFIISYALTFLLKELFEYLSTARFIMSNRFANRFFLYGNWGLIFFCYFALFLFVILTSRYINKQIQFKEPKNKKKEAMENE